LQGATFLDVLQLRTAEFPPSASPVFQAPAPSFPMAPYAGIEARDAQSSDTYRRFEIELLSPTRSNAIFMMNWPSGLAEGPRGLASAQGPIGASIPPCMSGPTGHLAVTPQGMLATFSSDYQIWQLLTLARMNHGNTKIQLGCLKTQLWAALLTNQLFLVISDPKVLLENAWVNFPALQMGGWSFIVDPTDPTNWLENTVLIFKFADKSLEELVDNLALWSAAGSDFNQGPATQGVLQEWIKVARSNAAQPEFSYFLNTVLKNWNGVLFVNCKVPPGSFPKQLEGLAAGIDMANFSAHHLGINVSPVDISRGTIQTKDSALFGLIYYTDSQNLVYKGNPYDFKVLSLRVLFASSDISSFVSQIELLVGELFGERSTLNDSKNGDNIVLNGLWQKHGSEDSYQFIRQGADTFTIESKVLETVLMTKAQFITLDQPDTTQVVTRFLFWGQLRFRELESLDLFSFGPEQPGGDSRGLGYSNMFVSMNYEPGATGATPDRQFAFEAGQMVFDLANSSARPQSLYSRFPLQVTGMLQGDESAMPADLGYLAVDSPLISGSLGAPWFGLQMALALGTQGSLAGRAGLTATLLAAWSPSSVAYNVVTAIRLPGSDSGKGALTIEGPLKLTIGQIALLTDQEQSEYLMRFDNIALSFLSVTFPPGGRTNVLLFGDPSGKSNTLGWYLAYKKDDPKKKDGEKKQLNSAGAARRRALPPAPENETEQGGGCGCR
jgi:hypothetical protein